MKEGTPVSRAAPHRDHTFCLPLCLGVIHRPPKYHFLVETCSMTLTFPHGLQSVGSSALHQPLLPPFHNWRLSAGS